MKRFFLYTLIGFTLFSCGEPQDQFRLTGEFSHLQQGEFYLYSPDGGLKGIDTIKVERGEFDYSTPLEDNATFVLLYPNFTQQVVFAKGGTKVTIEADARSLNKAVISGTKDNELMTALRLAQQERSEPNKVKAAMDFIQKHPESITAVYLFEKYLIQSDFSNPKEASKLYQLLVKNQPKNLKLTHLKSVVDNRKNKQVGNTLPQLTLKDAEHTFHTKDYKGKYLLLTFWASWENNYRQSLLYTRKMRNESNGKLKVLSVSLDVNHDMLNMVKQNDSVKWDMVCDFNAWHNDVFNKLQITSIPYAILVNPNQVIVAAGKDIQKDIFPKWKELIK